MRGDLAASPSSGVAVAVLTVLVLLAGCQSLAGGGGGVTPKETSPTPTESLTPRTPPTETATATRTPRPDISARRVAELRRFAQRVDLDTPTTGVWEFLGPETVRYRTTPDFDVRDQYGPGAEPPPEAIAREMVAASDFAPETAIIEVVSSEGEFLGEFNVTQPMARGLANYTLEPMDFVNETYRTGNYTEAYSAQGASVQTLYIDDVELRKAYLERTREWLSANASGVADNLVDSGLYNESFRIPKRDVGIKENSTIYFTLRIPENETSPNFVELHRAWPVLYGSKYYDRKSQDVTLQVRVYNESHSEFQYAGNYVSPFVNAYVNGEISEGEYDLYSVKYSVEKSDILSGVPRNLTEPRN